MSASHIADGLGCRLGSVGMIMLFPAALSEWAVISRKDVHMERLAGILEPESPSVMCSVHLACTFSAGREESSGARTCFRLMLQDAAFYLMLQDAAFYLSI